MGNKEKTTNQKIKQTMKFATIIAIAAVLSFSAEAQRNGDSDGDGDRDGGRGGRGRGVHRVIPRRFRNSDGALVGCRVRESADGPIGGGFMYQNEGEDTFVRTCWKDVDNCMGATTVHTAIGSFHARDSGKGRFFDPE